MYCPKCRAEFQEGFCRCEKCDADLVESLPEAEEAPAKFAFPAFDVAKWLKIGAIVFVVYKCLGVFLWNSPKGVGWGSFVYNTASQFLGALIDGLLFYGLGHVVELLGRKDQGKPAGERDAS